MPKRENKCRDCHYCTESAVAKLAKAPARVAIAPLRFVSWSMQRKCPTCGHPLKDHQRDASGRFKD